jgi:hypothetical protein
VHFAGSDQPLELGSGYLFDISLNQRPAEFAAEFGMLCLEGAINIHVAGEIRLHCIHRGFYFSFDLLK